MIDLIRLTPADNVAVAVHALAAGDLATGDGVSITATTDIPRGHKIALGPLEAGQEVIKYGASIGHTTEAIGAGAWVHCHNVATNLDAELTYTYRPNLAPVVHPLVERTFPGYRRANGDVGVRNDLYIVPMVGCVNGIAEIAVKRLRDAHPEGLPFDEVIILKHPYGCSQLGGDHETTRRILADAVRHPNAGGVLVFGLGCENNTMTSFQELLGPVDTDRVKFLVAQKVGDEIAASVELMEQLCRAAADDHREPVPLSALRIGLKCGGSDGFSGITANPLLGMFSDFLISQGGTTVMTEVPEMFGAETRLMNRAADEGIFESIVAMINGFKAYYLASGQPVYENPSPGNHDGGITTLEEKSLGCTQKSGTSAVVDVLGYGERLRRAGLTLLEGPGNDLVSSTNLASSGCQIVLFTTGRGTPFGTYVPTLKVATTTELAQNKPHWIDFDAGRLFTEDRAVVLEAFIDKVLATAGGERAHNETNGFQETAIFKNGVTL